MNKNWFSGRSRGAVAGLALACLAVTGLTAPPAAAATGAASVTAAITAATATVRSDGSFTVTTQSPAAWTFGGSVGHPVSGITTTDSSDRLGAYQEINFSYQAGVQRRGGIRVYQNTPVVLFTSTYLASGANSEPFPVLSQYPRLPFRLSERDAPFSPQVFNAATDAGDSPRLYFDNQSHAFLLSAASDFPLASTTTASSGAIVAGITSAVGTLPAGFTHRTILALGNGPNLTYRSWGSALLALGGKTPVANDANATLNRLGYWTDNGATYYYNFDSRRGYAGTLLAVKNDFAAHGIPLGYLQLDSWWYPKGSSNTWQGNGTNRGGEFLYQAAPELFPNGLPAFQQQLGLPLVTHARWVDPASPYHQQYSMSNDVITDSRFWNTTMASLKSGDVITYEQDWLSGPAKPQTNLTAPNAFLGNMANSAAAQGIDMQYCMPLPQHFLQSTLYQNLSTLRTSDDRFNPSRWDNFLYQSRVASALGAWPWSDVFMSGETNNLLLSTLSGGPVGVGDPIGQVNAANLAHTIRADGVIVKPDAAIVPFDSTYVGDAAGTRPPMVAGTFSQHGAIRDGYVFAYSRTGTTPQTASFRPSDLGIGGTAYVFDYFAGQGTVVPAGGTFSHAVTTGSYFVVVPIGASGIGFLGDTAKFVSLGGKRITAVSDDGSVHATIAFAANENTVTLRGFAPRPPTATTSSGTAGPVNYDANTHQFTVTVTPGTNRSAALTLAP